MSAIFIKTAPGQPDFTGENLGAWERQFAFGSLEPTALVQHAPVDQLTNSYLRPDDQNLANYNLNGRIHYFCDDTGFTDKGGGFQEWTREAATLPQNFNDYESYSYQFPGYYLGRQPRTKAPSSQLVKEFFLVGNTAAGANYATPAAIPQFYALNYAWAYAFPIVNNVIQVGGSDLSLLDGYLASSNANLGLFASVPSLSTYQTWASTDNANALSFSIEAADSVLEHLRGPIWQRTRRFLKAQ